MQSTSIAFACRSRRVRPRVPRPPEREHIRQPSHRLANSLAGYQEGAPTSRRAQSPRTNDERLVAAPPRSQTLEAHGQAAPEAPRGPNPGPIGTQGGPTTSEETQTPAKAGVAHLGLDEAERGGFEPPCRVAPTTRIPAVLLQPLGHLSGWGDKCNLAAGCRQPARAEKANRFARPTAMSPTAIPAAISDG